MASKKKNTRCPLQADCGRKCQHEGHELDCDFYEVNAIGGNVIEDQEQIRRIRDRRRQEELDEERYLQMLEDDPDGPNIVYLPIDQLHPHPNNPRKEIGDVTELADSIRAKGIFQNLTVVRGHFMTPEEWQKFSEMYDKNPTEELRSLLNSKWLDTEYTVIIGHRRRAGGKLAGLTQLPCAIVDMTPKEQVETMLLENMQREDLTPYEQAQGFQMMIDLGDTVEGIVEKTGFSRTTVKRRLEMARLNQQTLKEVSDRQISMEDFDRLAKIEDMGKRNEVLKSIGTNNFAQSVQSAINNQEIKKKLPAAKEIVKRLKAKQITWSETDGGKYTRLGMEIYLKNWDGVTIPVAENETRKIYYRLEEGSGQLSFYVETPKAKPVRKTKAELEKEKKISDVHNELKEMNELHYRLRMEFVEDLKVTSKNKDVLLAGAALLSAARSICYLSSNRNKVIELLKFDDQSTTKRIKQALDGFEKLGVEDVPKLIYYNLCDEPTKSYGSSYASKFPYYVGSETLDAAYTWLCMMGYQMSDDEIAMQNGTHRLLNMGK